MLRSGPSLVRGLANTATKQRGPNIVLVDAVRFFFQIFVFIQFYCRTPFCVSGTAYKDLWAVDLQKEAIRGCYYDLNLNIVLYRSCRKNGYPSKRYRSYYLRNGYPRM